MVFFFDQAALGDPDFLLKYTITFYENRPGYILVKYLEITTPGGINVAAGVQRKSTNSVLTYKAYNSGRITSNTFVAYDTEAGTLISGTL